MWTKKTIQEILAVIIGGISLWILIVLSASLTN